MFEFITNLLEKSGEVGNEVSPIGEVIGLALKAPFVYFIGLGLIVGVVGVVKKLRRR